MLLRTRHSLSGRIQAVQVMRVCNVTRLECIFFKDGIAIGVTDTLIVGTSSAHFVDGVCDGFVSGASLSGTFNPNNITSMTVVKGIITAIS